MSRLFPAIEAIGCQQLVLEFANREMAEVDCLARLADRFEIAAGVIDVKSFHLESADDVARRVDQVLQHVPAARLWLTADCGFSALPRHFAREKMRALVAGARLVRGRI
jgi:5-methyltetrahydropteroyltriglutamate--homocysteine methyltransferase